MSSFPNQSGGRKVRPAHRPAQPTAVLRLVPRPETVPGDPELFSFRRSVAIASLMLMAGVGLAHYWLVPPRAVDVTGEETATTVVALTHSKTRSSGESGPALARVDRLVTARPPAPRAPGPGPGPVYAIERVELVEADWEPPPQEPFEQSVNEEAREAFSIDRPAPERTRTDRRPAPPRPKPSRSRAESASEAPPVAGHPARVLRRRQPVYPRSARRAGVEGRVVLRVEVRSDGRVGSVRVATSSGSAALDSAAISAVKRWSFAPEKRGARAVSSTVNVPFRFSLR